jgi:glycosyltransferase involved in cell wall biosynthesis
MHQTPLVSVLIPAYNCQAHIKDALNSLLNQTYSDIEIIIVNDGSADQTKSEIGKVKDNRVKIFDQQNKGQCAASNKAFVECKGELIKFFDADDILNPENIELQVKRLNGDYEYVASSQWGRFYNDDLTTFKLNPESVWRDMAPVDWLVESWTNGLNMMQCALWLIPREILEKSGLWDERLSLNNDIDFFARVLLASKGVKFTPNARLYYRSGVKGSLSGTFSRKALEAAILSNELAANHLLAAEDSPRTRLAAANILQVWAYNTYPQFPDLTKKLEQRIEALGGSTYPIPGSKAKKKLSQLIGWKAAQKMHSIYSKLRYR